MVHRHNRLRRGPQVPTTTVTYVCFEHRYTIKASVVDHELISRRCPTCRKPLEFCGKNFKIPSNNDDKGWEKAKHWHEVFKKLGNRTRD